MKTKLLFPLKVLGLSVSLFILWKPLSWTYGFLLDLLLKYFYSLYHLLSKNDEFPYLASLSLIPLIALTLATPKIKFSRKALIVALGCAASLFLDFSAIQFDIREELVSGGAIGSFSYDTYRLSKWLLPFLIWIVFNYQFMSEYSRPATD